MADLSERPIIIKRVKKAAHAHHGGAWKIAYADFVTAMMAFFLLLWLISMTTPEQKKGLADYFTPPNVIASTSGAGGVLGGTAVDSTGAANQGASLDGNRDVTVPPEPAQGTDGMSGKQTNPKSAEALKADQDRSFDTAAASIRQAWQSDPNLTDMANNVVIEKTDEGLNIQLLNQEGARMFPEGSKYPIEKVRAALIAVGPILQRLPNQIRVSGHTAAGTVFANPRYGAWDLSSDRANVVREILGEGGLSDDHIQSVVGRATTEPYFAGDPYMAANERIQITALYGAPPVPPGLKP